MDKRLQWIMIILSGLLLAALWVLPVRAMTTTVITQESLPGEPTPLGQACGHGEQMPPWVLCLHGTVSRVSASGDAPPLGDATVTVKYGDAVVSGPVRVAPGETLPSYGIDISALEPRFLEPVIVTVTWGDRDLTRQVTVYPNFATQSQQFDLRLVDDPQPLDTMALFGSVVDFGKRGAVSGAVVTAQYGDRKVSASTVLEPDNPEPIYTFDWTTLNSIGLKGGDPITLKVEYNGDISSRQVVLGSQGEAPVQVNFATGWKCEDFDPLPRTSGGEGFPRTSGGEGFPDMACVWGYGVVDGIALPDLAVRLTLTDATYTGQTHRFPGEDLPRYGIAFWGAAQAAGKTITASMTYSGYQDSQSFTLTQDSQFLQRVDFSFRKPKVLLEGPYGFQNTAANLAFTSDFSIANNTGSAWIGYRYLYRRAANATVWERIATDYEGYINTVSLSPDCNESLGTGSIWIMVYTYTGNSDIKILRRSCGGGLWNTIFENTSSSSGTSFSEQIFFSSDYNEALQCGDVWVNGYRLPLYHYSIANQQWSTITLPSFSSDANSNFHFAISPNYNTTTGTGAIWLTANTASTVATVYRLPAGSSIWEQIANGFPVCTNPSMRSWCTGDFFHFSPDGTAWADVGVNGIFKLLPGSSTWVAQTWPFKPGMLGSYFNDVAFSFDFNESLGQGMMIVATYYGLYQRQAGSAVWQPGPTLIYPELQVQQLIASPDFQGSPLRGSLFAIPGPGLIEYRNNEWRDANAGLLDNSPYQILVTKNWRGGQNTGQIIVRSWQGIFTSTSGDHWNKLENATHTFYSGNVVGISPDYDPITQQGEIWNDTRSPGSSTWNVYRQRAGQNTWENLGPWPWADPSGIHLYFTPNYNERSGTGFLWALDPGLPLYRRSPRSDTWETVTTGLPSTFKISWLNISPNYDEAKGCGAVWVGQYVGNYYENNEIYYLPAGATTWVKFSGFPIYGDTPFFFSPNYDEVAGTGVILFGTHFGPVSTLKPKIYQYQVATGQWTQLGESFPILSNFLIALSPDYDGIAKGTLWVAVGSSLYSLQLAQPVWTKIFTSTNTIRDIVVSPHFLEDHTLFLNAGNLIQFIVPVADLSLDMSAAATALPDSQLDYSLRYFNGGLQSVLNPRLTLVLPTGVTFGSSTPAPTTINGQTLTWSAGDLAINTEMLITVTTHLAPTLTVGQILTATADVSSPTQEEAPQNNSAQTSTRIVAPAVADARVTLSGPPVLIAGKPDSFDLWVGNTGDLDAPGGTLTVELDRLLTFSTASPPPTTLSPLHWDLGALRAGGAPYHILLTTSVADSVPANTDLSLTASVSITAPENELSNNTTQLSIHTSLEDALTLIVIAPDRLIERFGAQPLLPRLQALARHPNVRGVLLDVERDIAVQSAYTAWDSDSGNWQKANAVAAAIKKLIDDYTITYPNLKYLVITGGDDVIPFYRIADQNHTLWDEHKYSAALPHGTVRAALNSNRLLSDDFYADRTATVPGSPFWLDRHALYLPDFAIGRLVGGPPEMIAVIDAFLDNNGEIALDPGLMAADLSLAGDLLTEQCQAYQSDGMAVICTSNPDQFRQSVLNGGIGSIWGTIHSNHLSLGPLSSFDLLKKPIGFFARSLLITLGCHAGLPVFTTLSGWPTSLAQAFASRGGTYVGSTTYAYGSFISVGYSESLALELTRQLLAGASQEIGPALVRAKQSYYVRRAWFDYLDEKVLLPVTLYGLPMLRVTTPDQQTAQANTLPDTVRVVSAGSGPTTQVTYTFDPIFTRHVVPDGVFYDASGETTTQAGLPTQPATSQPVEAVRGTQTLHGVHLVGADYTRQDSFDPLVAQSWALSAPLTAMPAEPPLSNPGWDRSLPYSLSQFDGLTADQASLNLVLGAYHAGQQVELLFNHLELELHYSDSSDFEAPQVVSTKSYATRTGTIFQVQASDNTGVAGATVIYDNGNGTWRSLNLTWVNGQWVGQTDQTIERFYVEVFDQGGNVSVSPWDKPVNYGHSSYLPLVSRNMAGVKSTPPFGERAEK